jgi:hypothetical protein
VVRSSGGEQVLQFIAWAFEALSGDSDMDPTHFELLSAAQDYIGIMSRISRVDKLLKKFGC